MADKYEIEIKSLLGSSEKADEFKSRILDQGALLSNVSTKQLNHYFKISDRTRFRDKLLPLVSGHDRPAFNKIIAEGKKLSIRTRDMDSKVFLVVKASIGDDTSANGVSRMEFEREVSISIDELDRLLEEAGLELEAKWSREREEYRLGKTTICLDKNAGYGWLTEFERVVDDPSAESVIRKELLEMMKNLGVSELSQERLERMFAHYNKNWKNYYGTEKVFNID